MNDDGWTDIINISNPDAAESANPSPAPAPQKKASAYWYENPGPSVKTSTSWKPYLIHDDVRGEQHGIADVDGDGKPEIYGACKDCSPQQTKGYYYADWDNPEAKWSYHAVTGSITFPFGGTGWMHGFGINDVNGDGEPDFLERDGIWIDARATSPNTLVCPAAGCGFVKTPLYGGGAGTELGGAHMYAFDVDGDGDSDIVSADFAHNYGISWYEQGPPLTFTKRTFVGAPNEIALYGVSFSQAHALQVADMDGDGVPDLITGKMRYAHPIGYGDPDIEGNPVLYVFKTLRNTPSIANGGSVTFEPHLVDGAPSKVGVGRQLAVGHANTDGILDICVATKLGLYVFLGQ